MKNLLRKIKYFFYSLRGSVVFNNGKNNEFILFDANGNPIKKKYIKNLVVKFYGDNNKIYLPADLKLIYKTEIACSDDNKIRIGQTPHALGIGFEGIFAPRNKLYIADNVSMIGVTFSLIDEPDVEIRIGSDCMFSRNILLRSSDGHVIIDSATNKIINEPKSIIINEHCWIGYGVTILKNSYIPKGSVVAAKAVYGAKSAKGLPDEGGYIFAGVPAKPIKSGINWARENTYLYKEKVSSQK